MTRRRGVGSILFRKLIKEARAKGYKSLRITTGAQNEAMRALASKFGAQLVFRQGESSGTIDVTKYDQAEFATSWAESMVNAVRAVVAFNRAYWRMLVRMAGGAPTEWGAS